MYALMHVLHVCFKSFNFSSKFPPHLFQLVLYVWVVAHASDLLSALINSFVISIAYLLSNYFDFMYIVYAY